MEIDNLVFKVPAPLMTKIFNYLRARPIGDDKALELVGDVTKLPDPIKVRQPVKKAKSDH